MDPTYIASCSFGKDSLATILLALEHNEPLDRVLFVECMFDHKNNISGEIPEHIEWVYNTAIPKLQSLGLQVDVVRPKKDYIDMFTHRIENSKQIVRNGKLQGYLISGRCKMNSEGKMQAIKDYYKQFQRTITYVGIAYDEPDCLSRLDGVSKISLLNKYHITESKAMEMVEKVGLKSPSYNYSQRGGCWFCPNCKYKVMLRFRQDHPDYWNKLTELGDKFKNDIVSQKFKYNETLQQINRKLDFLELEEKSVLFNIEEYENRKRDDREGESDRM